VMTRVRIGSGAGAGVMAHEIVQACYRRWRDFSVVRSASCMRMIAGLLPWTFACLVGWVVSVQGARPAWAAAIVESPEWKEAPVVAALFQRAGVTGTFVLLEEGTGVLHGFNPGRAAQRFTPASTFKIPNTLIGLSLGAVKSVDERIPYNNTQRPRKTY
jgi:hypothetical protein